MINCLTASLPSIGEGLKKFSFSFFDCMNPCVPIVTDGGASSEDLAAREMRELKCRGSGTVFLIIGVAMIVFGILFVTQTLGSGALAYLWGGSFLVGAIVSLFYASIGLCGDHITVDTSSDDEDSTTSADD